MKKILILTHYNFSERKVIFGPSHTVANYLKSKKISFKMISFPLYAGGYILDDEREVEKINDSSIFKKSALEFSFLRKTVKERFDLMIAVDPLNAFFGLYLKAIGKVKRLVFYTVDYADNRFESPLQNFIYHFIDRVAVNFSDEVWNVSTKILQKREKMGLSSKKSFFVPNSSSFDANKVISDKVFSKKTIVAIVGKTHSQTLDFLISEFLTLPSEFKLKVIGYDKKDLKSTSNVKYMGFLSKGKMLDEIKDAYVGIALYTDDFPWTKYGDSMKIRDYLSLGMPVITTNATSTAHDIEKYNLGILIDLKKGELKNAITGITKNRWLKMHKNAVEYSRAFDINKILESRLIKNENYRTNKS